MSAKKSNYKREHEAKALRRSAVDLMSVATRETTPKDARESTSATARELQARARDLWPEPVQYGDWTTLVEEFGATVRVRIEGRDGHTFIWLRDAASLAAKLIEYAEHEVAQEG